MNCRLLANLRRLALPLALTAAAVAQNAPADQPDVSAPVSYASVSQLNTLLSQLEDSSKTAQGDLAKLRIEKWKADAGNKRQMQSNVDSVQRNLQNALPTILTELRAAPESLSTTFRLYRNLDALYDVFSSVVEATGAFGPKDDFQSLDNDLNAIEKSRRSLADRMDSLAGAKDVELARLRTAVHNAQVAAAAAPPKKVIVDDTEPAVKKPVVKSTVKKKPAPKPPAAAGNSTPTTPVTTPAAKSQ